MTSERLTWLASRQALSAALADDPAAGRARFGRNTRIGLLLIDVDQFSRLAAALGPAASEDVLVQIGQRLREVLRPHQILVRLGGDEFAVVLPETDRETAERVAHSLLAQLAEPLTVDTDGRRSAVHVAASVGVATGRLPQEDRSALVRQAALAVSRAKQSGGGVSYFDDAAAEPSRLPPIGELRVALEQGDLEVYLQPQVDLATASVSGAEALARWRHPQDGVLLPAAFLPLAAQTGLMHPITTVVNDLAIAACARWWQLGFEVSVSVNLTASDLSNDELTDRIPGYLEPHGLPPRALRIEITEDAFLSDPASVAALIERWHDAGIVVALDDFGTGYSSLAYLRELPFGELKLDRVFVNDLSRPATSTIVRHTIAMSHDLGMYVVAEGIEDASTAALLAEMGCDVGQGIHFGAAMPLADFLDYLQTESHPSSLPTRL